MSAKLERDMPNVANTAPTGSRPGLRSVLSLTPAWQKPRRSTQTEQGDRHRHGKHPAPRNPARQNARYDEAEHRAQNGDTAPGDHGAAECRRLRKERSKNGHGGGGHHGAANALKKAHRHKNAIAGRQRGDGRRHTEDDETDGKHAPATETVGKPAAEKKQAAEWQPIGCKHKKQVRRRQAELTGDDWQRHGDERDGEDERCLHGRQNGECGRTGDWGSLVHGSHDCPVAVEGPEADPRRRTR